MTSNFGVLFLFAGVACFIFLLWLAMSPFGAIKLGDKNDTPEFKDFSWAGMLFCAGVGAGLLRWVLVEWGEYYTALPHGVAPGSVAAKEWATAYPMFHWGPLAWAFYCLPAITIAYPFYVKKVPWLRMSTGLYGILGEKGLHGRLIFLLWLAMSPFGAVKLGDKNDTPEFNDFSWAGMLFCAGVGAGLLRWVLVEWGEYYTALPHGVAPESVAAKEWATAYPLFHWGPLAWAFYCLPAITIAYPFYVKKVPWLRMSTGLYGILGEKGLHGPIAKLIDILVVLSLLGGAGYSLGVTTPMISGAFSHLTGLKDGFYLQVITALFCAAIFSTSAYFGLRKGIKILSDWNIYLALFLLGFIFVAGPTVFIFETSLSSLGYMAQNFIVMSTWTDPFTDSEFVETWTVFYWAWWVAYAPFVGLFVARISRGRTIRQVICGMLTYGSMGGMLFFMVMGNYAFDYTMNMDVAESAAFIQTMSSDYVTAIIQILDSLPLSKLIMEYSVSLAWFLPLQPMTQLRTLSPQR